MTKPGINIGWMDQSVDPGKDFYRYACGSYLRNATIPAGYSRWGSFYELRDRSLNRVHDILKELSGRDDFSTMSAEEQKLALIFKTGMNEAAIEEQEEYPLYTVFELIETVRSPDSLAAALSLLHQIGVDALFGFGSMPALDGSGVHIAAIAQGGLGLPDRDFYLKDDAATLQRLENYEQHIERMFALVRGYSSLAPKYARAVVAFEKKLAQISMSREKRRDLNAINNPTARSALLAAGGFNFAVYLETMEAPVFETLNVLQPDYLSELGNILSEISYEDLRAYLIWHVLVSTAPYLSKAFVEENFAFYQKTLNGIAEPSPRWREVVAFAEGAMGEAIGKLYVARYFPPEAKARVLEMIENGRQVMRQALQGAEWLSPESREKSLLKLDRSTFKIGYPDKWIDFEDLYLIGSYVGNRFLASYFHYWRDLKKIGQPFDKSEWNMTPQTVNAYANPLLLEVVFPAGILQPPLFDADADDAANYGAIMAVILHEFGHFFDDQGAKFDADGKLNMQWTADDYARFMEQIQLLRKQASRYTVGPNQVPLKGELVSGEAAADLNGARLALRALNIALEKNGRQFDGSGFTDEQRFFIAFAQVWSVIITPEALENQAMTDPHPPGEYRCNGTLAHMEEFAEAFGLPDNAPIMLPKEERTRIW